MPKGTALRIDTYHRWCRCAVAWDRGRRLLFWRVDALFSGDDVANRLYHMSAWAGAGKEFH